MKNDNFAPLDQSNQANIYPINRLTYAPTHMQAANDIGVADHDLVGLNTNNTAEALLAADLDGESLGEAFAVLSLEEQARYLDLLEIDCPWPVNGLEH